MNSPFKTSDIVDRTINEGNQPKHIENHSSERFEGNHGNYENYRNSHIQDHGNQFNNYNYTSHPH